MKRQLLLGILNKLDNYGFNAKVIIAVTEAYLETWDEVTAEGKEDV